MTSLVAMLAFFGFVVIGSLVTLAQPRLRSERDRQRATSVLLTYVLFVTAVASVADRDLWPFAAWRLVVGRAPAAVGTAPDPESLRIQAFDAAGVDHWVDYRAWQPLTIEDLSTWLLEDYAELAPAQWDEVGAHLLAMAEAGRRQALAGRTPGVSDRIFGPLSAPFHLLHPRRWSEPGNVPATSFSGIRFYREFFELESLRAGRAVRLELVHEYRGTAPE